MRELKTMSRILLISIAVAALAAPLAYLGFAADKAAAAEKYQAYLSPMPHNDAMHPNFKGKGTAVAVLNGDQLLLNGEFTGLASVATKAHICLSMGTGIPGKPVFEFAVPSAVEGKATGTFKLDPAQVAALKTGKLYLQIDAEKAPNGNLWGWLLPGHEVAGQDVPQKGPWFLPEFATKTK
jgi:hypothetical protein